MASIDDLLKALQKPENRARSAASIFLENNAETWGRIGSKDSFPELGLDQTELDKFLSDWCANNPYSVL